ncbi:hypothetical protein MSPP1_003937 [Malassezia sp. CBS 17886]|nr:hypothetical protein MSPP1_003937 [Malassezia sp. CBS 17886]
MIAPTAQFSGRPRRSTTRSDPECKLLSGDATPCKRGRSSRTLHRKTDHSVIERRRREKINDRLLCLQSVVPACRRQATEHVRKKAASHCEDDAMDVRLDQEMVLEKLCIISHTVDYVMELRGQVDAYKALCECKPSIPSPTDAGFDTQASHASFAHAGQTPYSCAGENAEASRDSPLSDSMSDGAPSPASTGAECTPTALTPPRSPECKDASPAPPEDDLPYPAHVLGPPPVHTRLAVHHRGWPPAPPWPPAPHARSHAHWHYMPHTSCAHGPRTPYQSLRTAHMPPPLGHSTQMHAGAPTRAAAPRDGIWSRSPYHAEAASRSPAYPDADLGKRRRCDAARAVP